MIDVPDDGKRAKSSVNYSRGMKDGDHCAICRYYISVGDPESKCKKVRGTVRAMMWCELFKKRGG